MLNVNFYYCFVKQVGNFDSLVIVVIASVRPLYYSASHDPYEASGWACRPHSDVGLISETLASDVEDLFRISMTAKTYEQRDGH